LNQCEEFFAADRISNLADLHQKLDLQCLPKGVDILYKEDCTIFTLINVENGCPKLCSSLLIQENLTIHAYTLNLSNGGALKYYHS
jgi:hypothetical protein